MVQVSDMPPPTFIPKKNGKQDSCMSPNAPQSKIVQVYSSNQFQSVGRMERANLWKRLGSEFVCYTLHAIYSCVMLCVLCIHLVYICLYYMLVACTLNLP